MNADTRNRIVMTAMELFWEKGFQSTSISDILSRTQVHSGSLYHFFPGKQDVLAAVLEAYRDGIEEWLLAPAWSGVDDPIERIFALLAGYRTQLVTTDCTYGCPIGSLALELHEPDPRIRDLLSVNFSNWTAAIERLVETLGLAAWYKQETTVRRHGISSSNIGHRFSRRTLACIASAPCASITRMVRWFLSAASVHACNSNASSTKSGLAPLNSNSTSRRSGEHARAKFCSNVALSGPCTTRLE